jgi:hypothetical protein
VEPNAQIFLSYAREDESRVRKLQERLSQFGISSWMDVEDILGGENWSNAIKEAIKRADFFLVCLSVHSVNKRGWVQKERRDALEILRGMLDEDIYLIPVRLEECDIPDNLSQYQAVDLFRADGFNKLIEAIKAGSERRRKGANATAPGTTSAGMVNQAVLDEADLKQIDLVCLQQKSLKCVLYWRDGRKYNFDQNNWELLSLDVALDLLSHRDSLKEVFVCLRGDRLIEGYDSALIGRWLNMIRTRCWEADVYVVKDIGIGINEFRGSQLSTMDEWFHEILSSGATDILEIEMADRYHPDPLKNSLFNEASADSRKRLKAVQPFVSSMKSKCLLHKSNQLLSQFLHPFVVYSTNQTHDFNVFIVVSNSGSPRMRRTFVEEILEKHSLHNRIVTWMDAYLPPPDLETLRDEGNLNLIHCRGPFELRYLLLRLNQPL